MTKLKYLDDTYLFETEAVFVEMRENEKGKIKSHQGKTKISYALV